MILGYNFDLGAYHYGTRLVQSLCFHENYLSRRPLSSEDLHIAATQLQNLSTDR